MSCVQRSYLYLFPGSRNCDLIPIALFLLLKWILCCLKQNIWIKDVKLLIYSAVILWLKWGSNTLSRKEIVLFLHNTGRRLVSKSNISVWRGVSLQKIIDILVDPEIFLVPQRKAENKHGWRNKAGRIETGRRQARGGGGTARECVRWERGPCRVWRDEGRNWRNKITSVKIKSQPQDNLANIEMRV